MGILFSIKRVIKLVVSELLRSVYSLKLINRISFFYGQNQQL